VCIFTALTSGHLPATLTGMDTMKFLLGATVALLFGAIVVSWQGMKQGVKNATPDELAVVKQQLAEIKQQLAASKPSPPAPVPSAEVQAMQAQLQAAKQQIERMNVEQQAKKEVVKDAKLKIDEEGLIAQKLLESKDSELKRARMIAQALLIGKVKESVSDPKFGGFIVIEVLMPEQVHVGAILGIRRNTGILGQFKVSEVLPEGAIANPMPGFGQVDPQPGDELIFPPQY
jgi:hypothetical protein